MAVERSSTILRGVLDLCLLALLDGQEVYGYEVADQLRRRGLEVSGGSVYPLLARLEASGDVRSRRRPSPDGPDRKYWTLTASGRRTLAEGRTTWTSVSTAVDGMLATHPTGVSP